MPDRAGKIDDVVLGFDDEAPYKASVGGGALQGQCYVLKLSCMGLPGTLDELPHVWAQQGAALPCRSRCFPPQSSRIILLLLHSWLHPPQPPSLADLLLHAGPHLALQLVMSPFNPIPGSLCCRTAPRPTWGRLWVGWPTASPMPPLSWTGSTTSWPPTTGRTACTVRCSERSVACGTGTAYQL